MTDSSGSSSGSVAGTQMTSSAASVIRWLPSVAMAMTRAPRARTSCRLEIVRSGSMASVTTATTGVPASISAIDPCLSSPAAWTSAGR